jgi:hypothetical protein
VATSSSPLQSLSPGDENIAVAGIFQPFGLGIVRDRIHVLEQAQRARKLIRVGVESTEN